MYAQFGKDGTGPGVAVPFMVFLRAQSGASWLANMLSTQDNVWSFVDKAHVRPLTHKSLFFGFGFQVALQSTRPTRM